MSTDINKVIHKINLNYKKTSPFKEWYYNFIFKITKGRATTLFTLLPWSWRNFYYDHIKTIFKPHHKRLRKAIPKKWSDLTHLIVVVNFEFIKSFYEDEYSTGLVDWDATEYHKKFATWLEKAYYYIMIERPKLLKQQDDAYPEVNLETETGVDKNGLRFTKIKNTKETYEELYGEVNRLDQLINKKDTKVLTDMIKYRDHFWT
jgi:hypothetical protein